MAVIARVEGESILTKKSEKNAKTVAIRYAWISMRKAVHLLTELEVT
jgi:hypothetical protein